LWLVFKSKKDQPRCQICKKPNHEVADCWHIFDEDYQIEERYAATAMPSYGIDTNCYTDTRATDHVMGELNKLTTCDRYQGQDQIHAANGTCMEISHVGNSSIYSPILSLQLNNVRHVPSAKINLCSMHKVSRDNNVFFEYHPYWFFIKDRVTRNTILEGRCVRGLYPIKSMQRPRHRMIVGVIKPSVELWHNRLGHPSFSTVDYVLKNNELPFIEKESSQSVCDACQKAKSHQLPYKKSDSVSSQLLELVFSDVWGPVVESVGRYKYYVSFIDDFNNFTWIYLIKNKSDVFQVFQSFQTLVERQFNRKILIMHSDCGGEYEKLNYFFKKIGIKHHVSCPHAHQQNGSVEMKHMHIVEVGLALHSKASMPLKFWDEAFVTVVRLINVLPSRIIQMRTPTEMLLQKKPDYSNLKVFGSACWLNLRPYNSRKLAFRST
jgi:hypothetical protein